MSLKAKAEIRDGVEAILTKAEQQLRPTADSALRTPHSALPRV